MIIFLLKQCMYKGAKVDINFELSNYFFILPEKQFDFCELTSCITRFSMLKKILKIFS